jgi:hypothetical protein
MPADAHERPYAGRVVYFRGRHYLLGTIWSDAGDRICDPIALEFTRTGMRACV